jgi:hypothetical protein
MQEQAPQPTTSRNLLSIAIGGFLLGVLLHFYLIFAILEKDEPAASGAPGAQTPVPAAGPAAQPGTVSGQPTPLADRTSCEAIRGTEYRSDSERLWFLNNCS